MDELERRRQQRDRDPAEVAEVDEPAQPPDDLSQRAAEAETDDHVAAVRDVDADIDDIEAAARDEAAESRDAEAAARDYARRTAAAAAGYAQGRKARADRDDAAEDRAAAAVDRDRARSDRKTARRHRQRAGEDRGAAFGAMLEMRDLMDRAEDNAEAMMSIGQAQGMIMTARNVTSLEALLQLSTRAAEDRSELEAAARAIVSESQQ